MVPLLPLPRLVFGAGSLSALKAELTFLGVQRPLLMSDGGLERAGLVAKATDVMPATTVQFLEVPENPTADGADRAYALYRETRCDGIVALGGGSVIDTAKIVAAMAAGGVTRAVELLGKPDSIRDGVAPLIAIPTTVGTGSESSPAAGLHPERHTRALGTRSPRLVPRVAICDPDLARTLPPRLIAATGVDALSHCIEGFFAEPANPIVDALALDGITRAFDSVRAATEPNGDAARANLMAAAFAGGAAIHKGLGPAHAVAIVCGDQGVHHGVLVAAALPYTVALVAQHAVSKAERIAMALGIEHISDIPDALRALNDSLGMPATLREAGYRPAPMDEMVDSMVGSHFNRTSPYVPTHDDYRSIVQNLFG
jgi:4-hydroxybutyrate dehydrogenase